jgi:hypothetical protein
VHQSGQRIQRRHLAGRDHHVVRGPHSTAPAARRLTWPRRGVIYPDRASARPAACRLSCRLSARFDPEHARELPKRVGVRGRWSLWPTAGRSAMPRPAAILHLRPGDARPVSSGQACPDALPVTSGDRPPSSNPAGTSSPMSPRHEVPAGRRDRGRGRRASDCRLPDTPRVPHVLPTNSTFVLAFGLFRRGADRGEEGSSRRQTRRNPLLTGMVSRVPSPRRDPIG